MHMNEKIEYKIKYLVEKFSSPAVEIEYKYITMSKKVLIL